MLDKPWSSGVSHTKQPCYQIVFDFKYWPMLGYFKKSTIIKLTYKNTSSEYFDEIHNIFLDGISEDMDSLV